MRRTIVLTISAIVSTLMSTPAVHAEKVGAFLDGINSADPLVKLQYAYYFEGVLDALMYANGWMGQTGRKQPVCFPDPIPSPEQLLKEFFEHIEVGSKAVGVAAMRNGSIDQVLLAGWLRKYPCPK